MNETRNFNFNENTNASGTNKKFTGNEFENSEFTGEEFTGDEFNNKEYTGDDEFIGKEFTNKEFDGNEFDTNEFETTEFAEKGNNFKRRNTMKNFGPKFAILILTAITLMGTHKVSATENVATACRNNCEVNTVGYQACLNMKQNNNGTRTENIVMMNSTVCVTDLQAPNNPSVNTTDAVGNAVVEKIYSTTEQNELTNANTQMITAKGDEMINDHTAMSGTNVMVQCENATSVNHMNLESNGNTPIILVN